MGSSVMRDHTPAPSSSSPLLLSCVRTSDRAGGCSSQTGSGQLVGGNNIKDDDRDSSVIRPDRQSAVDKATAAVAIYQDGIITGDSGHTTIPLNNRKARKKNTVLLVTQTKHFLCTQFVSLTCYT